MTSLKNSISTSLDGTTENHPYETPSSLDSSSSSRQPILSHPQGVLSLYNTDSCRIQLWDSGISRSNSFYHRPISSIDEIHQEDYNFYLNGSNNNNDISPSRTVETTTTLAPLSRYQIVLYKEGNIVVYNPDNKRLEARDLSPKEEQAIRLHRISHCPMCGQSIDPSRFTFQAQSYFLILQDLMRSRRLSASTAAAAAASKVSDVIRQSMKGLKDFVELPEGQQCNVSNPFMKGVPPKHNSEAVPQNLPIGMFATGYYQTFFKETRRLGSGSFGHVFLCHHHLDDVYLGEFAVKKIPVGDNKDWLQKMLREVKIRERLHNANVVEYKHSWLEMFQNEPHLPRIPWLFVLMEYCNGGDLESYLIANRFIQIGTTMASNNNELPMMIMNENQIWKLFFDIARGLNHLHHSGILHRDLKPQNILLQCTLDNLSGQPTTSALLADFGTSELVTEKAKQQRHGFTGTVEFTAPELLEIDEQGHFREDYDEKSDLWSLGVILYLLAFGKVPYFHEEPRKCRLKILQHSNPSIIIPTSPERSSDLILLVEALLQRNPNARPSLDDIWSHRRIWRRLFDTESLAESGKQISFHLKGFRNSSTTTTMEASPHQHHHEFQSSVCDPRALLLEYEEKSV